MSLASRCCARVLRTQAIARPTFAARRWNSTTTDPKINSIVDDISALTLLQTAELVATLKVGLSPFPPR